MSTRNISHIISQQENMRLFQTKVYGFLLAGIIGIPFTIISLLFFPGLFHIPLMGTMTFGLAFWFSQNGLYKAIRVYMAIMPCLYSNWFAAYFVDVHTTSFVAVNILNLSFYPWSFVLLDLNKERNLLITSLVIQSVISSSFLLYAPLFTPAAEVKLDLLRNGLLAPLTIVVALFFVLSGSIGIVKLFSYIPHKKAS